MGSDAKFHEHYKMTMEWRDCVIITICEEKVDRRYSVDYRGL